MYCSAKWGGMISSLFADVLCGALDYSEILLCHSRAVIAMGTIILTLYSFMSSVVMVCIYGFE